MPAATTVNYKHVDGTVGSSGGGTTLPDQSGHSGEFLTTDGSNLSWAAAGGGGAWGSITGTLSDQTDLQTALDAKAPLTSPNFATSARFGYSTASRVPYLDASKDLVASSVTDTELGYLSGVTSAIQTQLSAKVTAVGSTTDNAIVRFDGTSGQVQNSAVTIADTTGAMTFTAGSGANLFWTTDGAGTIGDLTANRPDAVCAKTIVRVGSSGTCYLYNPSGNGILRLANSYELTHSGGSFYFQVSSVQMMQILGTDGSILLLGSTPQFRAPYGAATKPIFSSNSANDTGFTITAADEAAACTNGLSRMNWDANGNTVCGTAAIATNATDGFFYIATCNGVPSGTPTTKTGRVPMVYDTANNDFYVYNGAWKKVTLA